MKAGNSVFVLFWPSQISITKSCHESGRVGDYWGMDTPKNASESEPINVASSPLKGLSRQGGDGLCAGGRRQRWARQKVGLMSTLQRAFRVHHRSGVKLHSFSPLSPIPKGPPLPFFSADIFALLSISSQSQFTLVLLLESMEKKAAHRKWEEWENRKIWTYTQ